MLWPTHTHTPPPPHFPAQLVLLLWLLVVMLGGLHVLNAAGQHLACRGSKGRWKTVESVAVNITAMVVQCALADLAA